MERVADVLGRKPAQFNTVSPEHYVSNALYQMCAENVDHLVVIQNDNFCGILTGADIANKVMFVDKPLNEIKVKEFMNRSLPVATLNDSIEYCMQLLKQYNTKYLVVYNRFDFKGVVSSYDLMQYAVANRTAIFDEEPVAEHAVSWNY